MVSNTIILNTVLILFLFVSFALGFCLGWRFAVKKLLSENKDLAAVIEK